jgi:hypothetical protein
MTEDKSQPEFYSRSVLSEKLGTTLKELTQAMLEAGWVLQEGKQWTLTAKGEFEGGIYRQSKKYGEYIVWPESILKHPMIMELSQSLVVISNLAQLYKIPARLLNCLLADMGWIEAYAKGWQVTTIGKSYGGVQHTSEKSGVPFVMWPKSIVETEALKNSLRYLRDNINNKSLNGHQLLNPEHCQIANWLYLLRQVYRYQQPVYFKDEKYLIPDFYLPSHQINIDFWPESLSPDQLAQQLEKREIYQHYQLSFIEIQNDQLEDLDNYLSKELLKFGISVY